MTQCISSLFNPVPETNIPQLLRKGRSRQTKLQEVLLDEILGPNNENVSRLRAWISEQAQSNPKIYAQIVTRLLPPNNDEPLATTTIQNTLVIIDQKETAPIPPSTAGSNPEQSHIPAILGGPEKQPQLPQLNNEPLNAAFSIPIKETSLVPKRKFKIKKAQLQNA